MPEYDNWKLTPPPNRFVSRDHALMAQRAWDMTDVELALTYQECVDKNWDMHFVQLETDARDLTLDDLEEILSDIQQ